MTDRPRLALAIPTLGRAETLEHNLRAILDEARALGVPIYISDDAPDDEETRVRVEAMARDYPAIHYSRNNPTLGHDANLIKTLTWPDADWVWLLADSLMIKPGEFTRIARSLDDDDFVFLNAIVPDAKAQTYRDAPSDQVLRELLWNQSLTGATIYHRRVIGWVEQNKPDIHRNFPQLSIILGYASAHQARIVWEPLKTMISLPKTSYWRARSVFQNWVGDWSTVVTSYPRIFSGAALATALSSHACGTGIFNVVNLVRYRGEGQLTAATTAMPYFRDVVPTPMALIRSILLIPPAAAAAMVKARRRLRGGVAATVAPRLPARRLSIAMATYNGSRYLPVQLQSFVDQVRLPDQLVVCDDGSSDETIAILQQFAKEAPFPVDIVRNAENLGHEGNFSQAMQLADGDVILLSDQDDRWDRDKLASVEQAFAADSGALLIVNDVRMTDGDLEPTGRTLLGQLRSSGMIGIDQRGLLIGCGTSFRKELKPLLLPVPPLNYGHDTWINDFAAFLGAKTVIDRPLQDYRRHQSNASATLLEGTARATPWMIMAPSKGQDLSRDWQKRVDALDEMHRRLAAFGDDRYAGLGLSRSRTAVLGDIAAARAAVVRRMTTFRKGFLGRKLLAAEMFARGDYRHFSGWRSFAKDLVR